MRIAVIEKCPSNTNYSKYFKFEFELHRLCSVKLPKVLKKDVDLELDIDNYDYIITVGSESSKHFAKITSVSDMAGHLVDNKFIPIINPMMIVFKPEGEPAFLKSLEKLHSIIDGSANSKQTGTWLGIRTKAEALAYLEELDNYAKSIGFLTCDTETTALYPMDGYVLGISLCAKKDYAAYISTECIDEEVEAKLQYLFYKYKVVFHNAKFDIKMLQYHFNFKFPDFEDTLLLHYVLDETQGTHGLKSLALKYTDFGAYDDALDDFKKEYCKLHGLLLSDFTYDLIPFDMISEYAAIDTAVTFALYNLFKPIVLKNSKLLNLYDKLLIPGTKALIKIETNGVPFDRNRLNFGKYTIDASIEEARNHLYNLPEVKEFEIEQGKEFNPNSVMQLRKLLFDKLNLEAISKKTGTGLQSTDIEVLESMVGQHVVVDSIITLRKMVKIKNTYIDKLLQSLDYDSRVRTGFNLSTTTSGRLSSSGKFNAQQLPRDEMRIKGAIKGTGKYEGWKIVSQDLATAEMYYAAVLSGDTKLQQVFIDKQDFHSSIAKQVFNLECAVEDVKKFFKDKRQAAKAISFGILYGSGAKKVSETVSKDSDDYFSLEDAQESIDLYFSTFSRLKKWLKATEDQIKAHGFIYTSIGRKRRLRNVFSPDKGIASHEVRSGINSTIQSLASDINLLATIDMMDLIEKMNIRAEIFMLVHDSIVAIVHPDDVELYCKLLAECTQKDRGFSIKGCPIGIDQEIGDDYSFGKFDNKWGELYNEYLTERDNMADLSHK